MATISGEERATTREEKLAALSCNLTDEEVDAVYERKRTKTLLPRLTHAFPFVKMDNEHDMTRRFHVGETLLARHTTTPVTFTGQVTGVTATTVFIGSWSQLTGPMFDATTPLPPSFFIFKDGKQVDERWVLT
jgi:hypothetical protein